MFGRFFDEPYRQLQKRFQMLAEGSVGDVFSVRVRLDDDLPLGFGRNSMQGQLFTIEVGTDGVNMTDPSQVFVVVEDFFHELRHVEHHADMYRGNAFSEEMLPYSIAYLAREQDSFRYMAGYHQNIFESDAHAFGILKAKEFCETLFADVDFDVIAVSVWRTWSFNDETSFVDNIEFCHDVDDLYSSLIAHRDYAFLSSPIRCELDSEMADYLKYKASDKFVDMWRLADTDMERNVLSAALFTQVNSVIANDIVPGSSEYHFCVRDFDVTQDVCNHMSVRYDRENLDILSKQDVAGLLRSAFYGESALELRSDNSKTHDIISVDSRGYHITHTGFDDHVPGVELIAFSDDAVGVLDCVVNGLATGKLYCVRGVVPSVVDELVVKRKSEICHKNDLVHFDISVSKSDDFCL